MVAWWWIIVALFAGAVIVALTISLCVAADRADESSYYLLSETSEVNMYGFEASLADKIFDEMRKLANRLEDEKRFSRLAEQDPIMEELWNEYCLLVYEDVW